MKARDLAAETMLRRTKRALRFIPVLLVTLSCNAFGEWQKVYPTVKTVWPTSQATKYLAGFDLYANRSILHTPNGTVIMSHMRDYEARQIIGDIKFISNTARYEYDCDKRLGRSIALRAYDAPMAEGQPVASFDVVGDWESVRPGSMLEVTWAIACNTNSITRISMWLVNAADYVPSTAPVELLADDGTAFQIDPKSLHNLVTVWEALKKQAGIDPLLMLADLGFSNAFAGKYYARRAVGISLQEFEAIGLDQTLLAAVLSHELAHLVLKHVERRPAKPQPVPKGGAWAGLVRLATAPIDALRGLRKTHGSTVESRDQERDADGLGMKLAASAGFNPCGLAIFLKGAGGQIPESSVASHPNDSERIQRVQQDALRLYGRAC